MENKETLLEIAKRSKVSTIKKDSMNNEDVELALAWVADEINLTQVAKAKKLRSISTAYQFISMALKKHLSDINIKTQ